jgi:hypothetical protein
MTLTTNLTETELLNRLNKTDFGPVAFKLMHPEDGEAWSIEQATKAIEKYRLFLILNYLYPDKIIVPSKAIDRVWHTHILDTAKYREDCHILFGQFMDHFPYFGMKDESDCAGAHLRDRQNLETAFVETQKLWVKHFGVEM